MAFLTIFSAPKPFTNPHINLIQRNAIRSWLCLGPEIQVLLVGDEAGLGEAAAEFGVPLLEQVERSPAGTPLVRSIFSLARDASRSPFLAYVNADILLTSDLIQATKQVYGALGTGEALRAAQHESPAQISIQPFLLIGQRWDLDVRNFMDFSAGWEKRLRDEVRNRGVLHKPAGSDFFVFPRSIFCDVPDFTIGRAGWDNWMIYHACQQGWPVIDVTPSVMTVHQNHDYSHLPDGKPHYNHQESQENLALAGGLAHMYMILDAQKQLKKGRLSPPSFSLARLARGIERRLTPKDGMLRGPRGALARRFRRLRRRLTE